VVLLGIGSDGHTASLFPGREEELADPGPLVWVPEPGLPPPHPRISFSLEYINAQPLVAILVSGEGKREILARVLAGDETLPAARVRAAETAVLADEAAAPR
ncbi:MAG: 6-phosphogluconolactonase, partial [Thermoleophilaceae bacterium]